MSRLTASTYPEAGALKGEALCDQAGGRADPPPRPAAVDIIFVLPSNRSGKGPHKT